MNILVRGQHVRSLHRAVASWKDALDNEKYKKKLEKVQGQGSAPVMDDRVIDSQKPNTDSMPSQLQQRMEVLNPPDLNQVMKVDLIRDKSKDEISQVKLLSGDRPLKSPLSQDLRVEAIIMLIPCIQIWVDYHKTKDCISVIVPGDTYLQLTAKAIHCPMFVYPLRRNEGYEMWLSQFSGHKCYFTSLINYQMFQENAPHSLVLTCYTEFLDSKGLVLVHGELDLQHLTTLEAQNLTNQMQLYYEADLYALVREFNHNPQNFDYKQLLDMGTRE